MSKDSFPNKFTNIRIYDTDLSSISVEIPRKAREQVGIDRIAYNLFSKYKIHLQFDRRMKHQKRYTAIGWSCDVERYIKDMGDPSSICIGFYLRENNKKVDLKSIGWKKIDSPRIY